MASEPVLSQFSPLKPIATDPPFVPDLLGRKKLADRLTGHIQRLSKGHVIAIDADWGDGKTWFGLNWQAQLENDGYPTLWLDAFECDHNEDPFIPIVSQLIALEKRQDENPDKKFVEAAVDIGRRILPAVAKGAVSAAITFAVGKDGADALTSALDNVDELTEAYFERRVTEFDKAKNSVKTLKEKLSQFAANDDKPLVYFIDELDRCRPDFAIKLIERIKHFFDTPNVVFVLLINRRELEAAIRGYYGESFNAESYLGKFIHLTVSLPKPPLKIPTNESASYIVSFARNCIESMGLNAHNIDDFAQDLPLVVHALKMSLRDIERCLLQYQLLGFYPDIRFLPCWLVCLQKMQPDLFNKLKTDFSGAHETAVNLLNVIKLPSGYGEEALRHQRVCLIAFHNFIRNLQKNDEENAFINHIIGRFPGHDKTKLASYIFEKFSWQ